MAKKIPDMGKKAEKIRIKSLEDLIRLNLDTLESVVIGEIDNRKAQLIFTGSRTISSTFKLGLEAIKIGMKNVAGLPVRSSGKLIKK